MKLKVLLSLIVLAGFLLLVTSCEGEFIEDSGAIALSFPFNKEVCQEGTPDAGKIRTRFEWSSTDAYDEYSITIFETNNPEDIISMLINSGDNIPLDYSTNYTWTITGTGNGLTSRTSDPSTFSTQGLPNPNFVPEAVEIFVVSNNGGTITFSWRESQDQENNAIVYNVFFDENQNPQTPVETNLISAKQISRTGLITGTPYYIKIETKEVNSDNSSSSILRVVSN